jgi:hypothetical protein
VSLTFLAPPCLFRAKLYSRETDTCTASCINSPLESFCSGLPFSVACPRWSYDAVSCGHHPISPLCVLMGAAEDVDCRPGSTFSPGRRLAVATDGLGSSSVNISSAGGGGFAGSGVRLLELLAAASAHLWLMVKTPSSQLLALFLVSLCYGIEEMRGGLERLGEDLVNSVLFWERCSGCLAPRRGDAGWSLFQGLSLDLSYCQLQLTPVSSLPHSPGGAGCPTGSESSNLCRHCHAGWLPTNLCLSLTSLSWRWTPPCGHPPRTGLATLGHLKQPMQPKTVVRRAAPGVGANGDTKAQAPPAEL